MPLAGRAGSRTDTACQGPGRHLRAMEERTLVFPEDVSVGRLDAWHLGAWRPSVPARGIVRVPADALVFLDLHPPIRGLGCLRADDVYSLHPHKRSPVDSEMRRLAHLTGLRELHCSKAHKLTDAALAHIGRLRHLRELDLYATGVSDAGLLHLAGMIFLRRLHLGMTRVQGAGLRFLASLQRLEWISLEDTAVDDSVVPHLAALRSLRKIALWGTRMSAAGIARLRRGLPQAVVVARDPGRRLARERSERAMLQILARRLSHRAFAEASPEELLELLLPKGTVFEWRTAQAGGHLCRFDGHARDLASHLLRLPYGMSLRITTPDRRVWRIAWLRRRTPGGRRADTHRRGGRRSGDTRTGLLATPRGTIFH